MQYKLTLKFSSLLVIVSFFLTNLCIAQYTEYCTIEEISFCCENTDENISGFLDSVEGCCFEIKDCLNTQPETILNSSETNLKPKTCIVNYYHAFYADYATTFIPGVCQSIHSPPADICILNSNLRI